MTEREIELALGHYEGLVKQTARMLCDGTHPDMRGRQPIEDDPEDVEQLLRIKLLKGLRSFDPSRWKKKGPRGRSPRDMYVYMCVRDQAKDIAKRRRRHDQYIEDYRSSGGSLHDAFDNRYLAEDHDTAFKEIEDELSQLPESLTERERKVMMLMYREHRQTEIARILEMSKREVESAVRQIRVKMAGWGPANRATPAPAA